MSANGPHRLLTSGLMSKATEEVRSEIDSKTCPVYKTTWKLGDAAIPGDTVLGYLLSVRDTR